MNPIDWVDLGATGALALYVGAELRAMRRAWERMAVGLARRDPLVADAIAETNPPPLPLPPRPPSRRSRRTPLAGVPVLPPDEK